jgi:hypothetical protein
MKRFVPNHNSVLKLVFNMRHTSLYCESNVTSSSKIRILTIVIYMIYKFCNVVGSTDAVTAILVDTTLF